MAVGSNIKRRRMELGMSQQELADAMGYKTRSTIAKIEAGENDVTNSKLARFAQVLHTSVECLIAGGEQAEGLSAAEAVPAEFFAEAAVQEAHASGGAGRTAAVILAGGTSSRNQQNMPNQFISILGKPVIAYCLDAYQAHPAVDDIYVVCLEGWEHIVSAYAKQYGIDKLRGMIPAGSSGILSVLNGLNSIRKSYGPDDIVIFQESTRPLVNVDMISKLLKSCYKTGSANICQPMRDILQFTRTGGKPSYVDRDSVVEIQSPEAYRLGLILSVFEEARRRNHPLSESCCAMLMYNLGYEIGFIEGSVTNYKILRQEDIAIVTAMIQRQKVSHGV